MEFHFFSFFLSLFSVFSGNETTSRDGITNLRNNRPLLSPPPIMLLGSAPELHSLCPKEANSTDSMLILMTRYHKLTKRCYKINSEGPCGNNMKLYAVDDTYGECRCDQDSNRLLIYHKKNDQCYHIFQQAYCLRGFWLDINRKGKPVCLINPCKSRLLSASFRRDQQNLDLVLLNGQCKEVGKLARPPCADSEIVGFIKQKRSPRCVPSRDMFAGKSIGVPSTPCDLGSSLALDGRCSPHFDFD